MTPASRHSFSSCSSPAAVSPREPGWNAPSSALCYHPRPSPGRRRRGGAKKYQNKSPAPAARTCSSRPWMSMQCWVLILVLGVLSCCGGVEAGSVHAHRRRLGSRALLFDASEPPPLPRARLIRRDGQRPNGHNASEPEVDSEPQSGDQGSQISLPRPFDTSLGSNFTTSSCPTFFNDFLSDQTFANCLPLSLLLQTSNGFFSASRSLPRLTQTLDATCNVDLPQCSTLMADLAVRIQLQETCGADLGLQNPIVTQAYNGFLAYQPLYHAGCLTDARGNYCFANAVTNASAPSSSYVYYLPLGVSLPGGTQPTCDTCLKQTMSIFATYASNSTQPLSADYGAAASQLDMTCGPTFVTSSVQASTSAAPSIVGSGWVGMVTLFAVLWFWAL